MTTQIRQAVFETNSSSSHSLTMGKAQLSAQPFAAPVLRAGRVTLKVGEYGWEYHRYYTAEGKLNYLLTQLTGGSDIPDGNPLTNAQVLADRDERIAMLFKVVKEHTGCDVAVEHSSGYIDHDSVGVGTELFNSEDTLRAFLFDETACVETSNDNSPGPWKISTDKGEEFYYERYIRDVPKTYVSVEFSQLGRYSLQAFGTSGGGVVSEDGTPELFKELCERGIAIHVHHDCVDSQDPFEYRDIGGESASTVTGHGETPLLHLARDFSATHTFKQSWDYPSRKEDVTIVVKVSRALAQKLKELPSDGVARYHLGNAEREYNYWTERAKEAKGEGKPEKWAEDQAAKFKKDVAKFKAMLKAA